MILASLAFASVSLWTPINPTNFTRERHESRPSVSLSLSLFPKRETTIASKRRNDKEEEEEKPFAHLILRKPLPFVRVSRHRADLRKHSLPELSYFRLRVRAARRGSRGEETAVVKSALREERNVFDFWLDRLVQRGGRGHLARCRGERAIFFCRVPVYPIRNAK